MVLFFHSEIVFGIQLPLEMDIEKWKSKTTQVFGNDNDYMKGYHLGDDINVSAGIKIRPIAKGVVKYVGDHPGPDNYGGMYIIEHPLPDGETVCAVYAHLNFSSFTKTAGDQVEKEDCLGEIGTFAQNGGWSEHLHFGIRKGGYISGNYYYMHKPNGTWKWYWAYVGYTRNSNLTANKTPEDQPNYDITHKMMKDDWYDPTDFIQSHQSAPTRFMDFEDGVDEATIKSNIPGIIFTTTQGHDWIYGDWRAGYNGPYPDGAYYSNGHFFAWLGPNQGAGRIDFTGATATYLSVLTSTASGLTMDAYDSDNNWLANSGWADSNINTGEMTKLTVAAPNMAYVLVHDTGNRWLIDDLEIGDLLAEAKAYLPAGFLSEYEDLDTLDQNQPKWKTFFNKIYQTLKIILGWGGSELSIQIYKPDGTLHNEYQSKESPIIIDIPNAEPGLWEFKITAVNVPNNDYPFALVVGALDDTMPPIITLSVSPDTLWPPNHKMVLITPVITATDNCDPDPVIELTSITMSEGEDDDIQVDEDGNIYLRAERLGTGDGRIYIITYTATDVSGNSASASAAVTVPHNQ